MNRIIAKESKIPLMRVNSGEIIKDEWENFVNTIGRISICNLFIDDSTGATPEKIKSELDIFAPTKKIDIIIVDYLQLMNTDKKYRTRSETINNLLVELKQIAVHNNLVVLVLSQLNRIVRDDKRPQICDVMLSDSSRGATLLNLECVDTAIALYREKYYEVSSLNDKIEYHIVKNNNGRTGVVIDDRLPFI